MMEFVGKTDVGSKRQNNQDAFLCARLFENAFLAVVCDGMGGCNGGNVASETAVNVFTNYIRLYCVPYSDENGNLDADELSVPELLRSAVKAANDAVFKKAGEDESLQGMGTTLVAAFVVNSSLYAVNVGDSRFYMATEHELLQITHDHSYVQYLVDIGEITPEEAASNPNRNVITRAVGSEATTEADIYKLELPSPNPNRFLLCTDGLTNFLDTETIYRMMRSEATGASVADMLISGANAGGGGDNITVVIGRE